VVGVKAAPDLQALLVQQNATTPTFDLVDIRNREVKSTVLTLPTDKYSDATTEGIAHDFKLQTWDESGRHILVKHTYGDSVEWIVMDVENIAASTNVTQLLGLPLTDIQFAGTSGNILYGLADGDIRRLDLSGATISRVLVSKVTSFAMYGNTILTYVGEDLTNPAQRVVGFYREGDQSAYVLQTFTDASARLAIDTSRYHDNDYIAFAENNKVTILEGSYPNSEQLRSDKLVIVAEWTLPAAVDSLSISPDGSYVIAQAGSTLQSYEIEHDRTITATVDTSDTQPHTMQWLDKAYVSGVYDNKLTIREYDGANVHQIMPAVSGFDVTLSQNGRYIYGVNNTDGTFRLERVTMILE
jgi:WD40 repeat protein